MMNMNFTSVTPYRFSNNELLLLDNLFEIFTNNGFTVDRWPEVYYCDYNEAAVNFNLPEKEFDREERFGFNPDYLGIYLYNTMREGIVILFKDRIYQSAKSMYSIPKIRSNYSDLNFIITLLKAKVLVHEIGHWLTHSCSTIYKQDILENFMFLPKNIIESMAQLTVVWSFYKHKSEFEYQLEKFGRLFMPMQPYPYYEFSNMNHIYSPDILLARYLGIASQKSHLNSQTLFDLLSKNETDLSTLEKDLMLGKKI